MLMPVDIETTSYRHHVYRLIINLEGINKEIQWLSISDIFHRFFTVFRTVESEKS